jgi:hypothetical protein
VHLTPHEQQGLPLSYAAELARRRRAGGLQLNLPEATAIAEFTADLGAGEAAWLLPVAPWAYASTVHIRRPADGLTADDAFRLPLPCGWVLTAWGAELHRVVRALDALGAPVAVPA